MFMLIKNMHIAYAHPYEYRFFSYVKLKITKTEQMCPLKFLKLI